MKYLQRIHLLVVFVMGMIALNVQAGIDIHYVVNDHLGTPQLLVDEEQKIVWKAGQDAFGNDQPEIEQVEFNIRFPGQYYDKETGTHYNYYRDFDPALGRYLQSDPRGILLDFSDPQRQVASKMGVLIYNEQSALNHTYSYANGNPVFYIDSTGEALHIGIGVGIGLISGAIAALNDPCTKNWEDIALSAFAGGVAGGVGAVTLGAGLLGGVAAGASGNFLGQTVSKGVGQVDYVQVATQGAVGGVAVSVGAVYAGTAMAGYGTAAATSIGRTAGIATGLIANMFLPSNFGGLNYPSSSSSSE